MNDVSEISTSTQTYQSLQSNERLYSHFSSTSISFWYVIFLVNVVSVLLIGSTIDSSIKQAVGLDTN